MTVVYRGYIYILNGGATKTTCILIGHITLNAQYLLIVL